MDYSEFPPPSRKLDLRVIFVVPLRQFVWWLGIVLIVTFAGYPGVVCVTPAAWLVALRVGNQVAGGSRSVLPNRRLTEAALAGGLLGLLQGVLFMVIIPFMGPVQTDELANATGITTSASASLPMLNPQPSSSARSASNSTAPNTPKTTTALIATGQNSAR
jgi:hypothetical protein